MIQYGAIRLLIIPTVQLYSVPIPCFSLHRFPWSILSCARVLRLLLRCQTVYVFPWLPYGGAYWATSGVRIAKPCIQPDPQAAPYAVPWCRIRRGGMPSHTRGGWLGGSYWCHSKHPLSALASFYDWCLACFHNSAGAYVLQIASPPFVRRLRLVRNNKR